MKEIVILGGPNGAGKTTAARKLLSRITPVQEFLNADEFAREICPEDVDSVALAAGRMMRACMRKLVAQEVSFGFESTLAGKSYARFLQQCKESGWRITLLYLWLPTAEDAIERVAQRVREGGHGIPPETIRRRYRLGIANFLNLYLDLANEVEVYDNSQEGVRIAQKAEGGKIRVLDMERWAKLMESVR